MENSAQHTEIASNTLGAHQNAERWVAPSFLAAQSEA